MRQKIDVLGVRLYAEVVVCGCVFGNLDLTNQGS